jgi:hypothetical protein
LTARERWAAAGITAFRLPSGFIVSGVWPSFTELTSRGVLPWPLRRAVLEHTGAKLDELTEEQIQQNIEQRLRVAASFVRQLLDDETGEWEPMTLTYDELSDGSLPGDDVEALDTFVAMGGLIGPEAAAWALHLESEIALGLRDRDDISPAPEESGVASLTDFREERGSEDAGRDGEGVEPAPVADARPNRSARRTDARRRPRAEAAPRAAAG